MVTTRLLRRGRGSSTTNSANGRGRHGGNWNDDSASKNGGTKTQMIAGIAGKIIPLLAVLTIGALTYSNRLATSSTDVTRYLDLIKSDPEQAMKLVLDDTTAATTKSTSNAVGYQPETVVATIPDTYREALVDCAKIRQQHADVEDPNADIAEREKYIAWTNRTMHPFYVSLHNFKFDSTRAVIKQRGRYYETVLQDRWGEILSKAPPDARVLDVGGNIGYYSLFSASFGPFAIDTFEPNPTNLFRFCESLQLNGWTANEFNASRVSGQPAVNAWQMGASNVASRLKFSPNPRRNPGAGMIVEDSRRAQDASLRGALMEIQVTTLDDFAVARGWLPSNNNDGNNNNNNNAPSPVRIEILKVDVEQHEAQVFLGASRLLASRQVRHVFTEFTVNDGMIKTRVQQTEALAVLREAGYHLCGIGGFKGPTNPSPYDDTDPDWIEKLMRRMASKKEPTNLWFQAELPCWEGQ